MPEGFENKRYPLSPVGAAELIEPQLAAAVQFLRSIRPIVQLFNNVPPGGHSSSTGNQGNQGQPGDAGKSSANESANEDRFSAPHDGHDPYIVDDAIATLERLRQFIERTYY